MPLADPTVFRTHDGDHPVEVRAGAGVHVFPIVPHAEEVITVVTPIEFKLIKGLNDGADQAGPQVTQILRYYVHRHFDFLAAKEEVLFPTEKKSINQLEEINNRNWQVL